MKNSAKDVLAYILFIITGGLWLLFFICQAIFGKVTYYEPNKIILGIEIALCAGMLALGIERLRSFIKRLKQ